MTLSLKGATWRIGGMPVGFSIAEGDRGTRPPPVSKDSPGRCIGFMLI